MSEFTPLPDKPELTDLKLCYEQLHSCVEAGIKAGSKRHNALVAETKKNRVAWEHRFTGLEADMAGIKKAFNITNAGDENQKTSRKPVGLMGRWEFVRNISTSGVIIIAIWKAIDALWPELGTLAVAIEHYVRTM